MGKSSSTPEGPKWKKLLKRVDKLVAQNKELFTEGMAFGKDQFKAGKEWVDKLEKFGQDASGRLRSEADSFKADVAKTQAGLTETAGKIGKTALDQYGSSKALAGKTTDALTPGMESSAATGTGLVDRYKQQGIPFQDEYIKKLTGWDTAARREGRAAEAVSDVNATTEAARESELRRLESFGIDPSQTRSAALDSRIQAQNAVAKAQAANLARRGVEAEGLTLGKTASDMYNESLTAGRGMLESAGNQGANIYKLGTAPGQEYMTNLGKLGELGVNIGALGQRGGAAGFEMDKAAEGFEGAGISDAGTFFHSNRQYGSGVYDQGSKNLNTSANMLQGGYQTAGSLHANDLQAAAQEAQNSPMAGLGKLAGVVLPSLIGAPWMGPLVSGAMGAGGAAASGAAAAGTGMLAGIYGEGGPVPKEHSPSRGAIPDDIPAFLDADEFVLDRNTVRWHGIKNLSKLQKEAREGLAIPEGPGRNQQQAAR